MINKCAFGTYAPGPYSKCTPDIRIVVSTTNVSRAFCNYNMGYHNRFSETYLDATDNVGDVCIDTRHCDSGEKLVPSKNKKNVNKATIT